LEVALVWLESQRLRELVGTTFDGVGEFGSVAGDVAVQGLVVSFPLPVLTFLPSAHQIALLQALPPVLFQGFCG